MKMTLEFSDTRREFEIKELTAQELHAHLKDFVEEALNKKKQNEEELSCLISRRSPTA